MPSTPDITLVVLAAGLGRRFGGSKQITTVGPAGETLIDYAVFDAMRAGATRVVFVIRRDIEREFRSAVSGRIEQHIGVSYAYQDVDLSGLGFTSTTARTRPWGTGHAVLVAAEHVTTPFVVVNADDFYGREAYTALSTFVSNSAIGEMPAYAIAGYRLRETLPTTGGVSRGLCDTSADGWLERIVEVAGIERDGDGGLYSDRTGRHFIPGDTRVSMNMWGFLPNVGAQLREQFAAFAESSDAEGEFYLPTAVGELVTRREARVRVLSTNGRWCGVTRSEDRDAVISTLGELTRAGEYPTPLWSRP